MASQLKQLPRIKMASSKSRYFSSTASVCSGHNQKKLVLVLCVITWAAIFFISGTLFIRRRYEMANQLVSKLSSSLQEQIDYLSSEVSKGKDSAKDLTQALHEKINLTLSSLDEKIDTLEKEFAEKRKMAVQALHALHGRSPDTDAPAQMTTQSAPAASGSAELKSSAIGMCVDSMEQPVGSDLQLNTCHGEQGNQAWSHQDSNRLIENKAINMCLRAADGNDGSSVRTAGCDENDTYQKWNRLRLLFMLDDGAEEGKCLDVDPESNKLVIKRCDSTKDSQQWL